MSRYTTQVRFICENAAGLTESKGFNDVEQIIETAAPIVFNFDFPIFDETYRLALEKKILRHYYTREICAETVGLWKLWLSDKLNMVMPYYNQLYTSATLQFNPFYDVDLSVERTVENDGTTVGSNTNTSTETNAQTGNRSNAQTTNTEGSENHTDTNTGDDWSLFSDTPQGGIVGVQNASVIDAQLATYTYLTTATENKINETKSGNSSDERETTTETHETSGLNGSRNRNDSGSNNVAISNVEDYIEHVQGKRGGHTYSGMLLEYRKTILNIDAMVIDELQDLFFNLWD